MGTINLSSHPTRMPPVSDGAIQIYADPTVRGSDYFDNDRRVIFINGMSNSPQDHLAGAEALSRMQMCPVIGVYNKSGGFLQDFAQCVGDKQQFNGLWGPAATEAVRKLWLSNGGMKADAARTILSRNPCQVQLFDLLSMNQTSNMEIFAHSQGNLILSNALQALVAVKGAGAVRGRIINTFGSPAVKWPAGIIKREHGFTFDPVNWLSGFDRSFSISKIGMPSGSFNPITHAFLIYVQHDPEFVVNRYRVGGWGMTLNMDEEGLAGCLVEMGENTERVLKVFQHLDRNHNSDADDVAEYYLKKIEKTPLLMRVKANVPLRNLLYKVMDEGITTAEEKRLMALLKA